MDQILVQYTFYIYMIHLYSIHWRFFKNKFNLLFLWKELFLSIHVWSILVQYDTPIFHSLNRRILKSQIDYFYKKKVFCLYNQIPPLAFPHNNSGYRPSYTCAMMWSLSFDYILNSSWSCLYQQSSRWASVLWPKTSKTLSRPVNCSVFIYVSMNKFNFSFQGLYQLFITN
jgi:hypothetical protein